MLTRHLEICLADKSGEFNSLLLTDHSVVSNVFFSPTAGEEALFAAPSLGSFVVNQTQ